MLLAWIVFVRDETSWLGHFTFATYQSWLVIGFLFLIESVEQKLQRTLKDHTVVFRKIYKNAGLLAAINGVLGSDCDALTAKRNLAQALSKSLGRPFGVGRKPKLDLAHVERLLILTRGGKLTEGIAVHKLAPYLFEHVECLVAADGESFDLAARRAIRQGKVLLIDREVTCREDRVVSKPLIAKTEVTVGTNEELVVAATLWCALGHQYWRLPLVEHLGIWVQGGKLELRNIAIGPARGQLTGSDI